MITIEGRRRPSPGAVLDRAVDAMSRRLAADRDLLVAAAEWAEAHPATSSYDVAGWGEADLYDEGFLPLAGEGAPLVAEFAPCELAAALGWSTDAAQRLIGDALELHARLPLLWRLVCDLAVPVHLARYAAEQTHDLARDAAAHADRLLTRSRRQLTQRRIRDLVDEARLYHDPDRAVDDEQRALSARKVVMTPGTTPATADLSLTLDTADAEAFDASVSQVAHQLATLGDTDPLQIRRARAVGILADPQRALELLTGTSQVPGPRLHRRRRCGCT